MRILLLLAVAVACCAPAWGSACVSGVLSSAGYASGCTVGNLLFSNFSVGTTTNTIVGPVDTITGSGTDISAGGALNSLADVTASISGGGLNFTTGAEPTAPPGTCPTGSPNWCIAGNGQTFTGTVTYEVTGPTGSLYGAAMSGTLYAHTNASTVIMLETCSGSSLSAFAQAAFCTGAGGVYHVAQAGSISSGNVSGTFSTGTSFAATSTVWVRETVYLTLKATGASGVSAVGDFNDSSFTPEPATYGMVGLALAGLGALRLRKRKN